MLSHNMVTKQKGLDVKYIDYIMESIFCPHFRYNKFKMEEDEAFANLTI